MAQLRALGNSLRQPAVASSGRLEAGRSGAARGHRVARTVLAAAAATAAAAALGRMVLPLMARLLSGSKTQAKQPSPEDRAELRLALVVNELIASAKRQDAEVQVQVSMVRGYETAASGKGRDAGVQVRNAAFGCVPGRDWHNKNALTKRVAPVKDMSRVGVVPQLDLSYDTLEPAGGWELLREMATVEILQAREFWRLALCTLIDNLYLSAQATLGLARLMLPHLRATIARQTAKLTNMVEADGNEDGYPALLPDIQREVALGGELGVHIANAAHLAHLMCRWEQRRAHKREVKRFDKMQGFEDRGLPVPNLSDVLWLNC
ncbi:hypothetical protein COHA_007812 [Chlorella ohadii]|uniref:Uncharacterized protein n=1 Tax=Chlorella ohadii TaxID=2649997 RepID=A0AAD5DL57_9CHLO|nr:hypothetical protein COHA_007812 [Chlorella ohadii]